MYIRQDIELYVIFPFWDLPSKLGGSGPSSEAYFWLKARSLAALKQTFEALFKRVLADASPLGRPQA